MKKFFLISLILLIMAGLGAGGYYVYAQNNKTEYVAQGNVMKRDVPLVRIPVGSIQVPELPELVEPGEYDHLGEFETIPIEPAVREPGEKVAYLTFDDGPGEYTEMLLDILDMYEVKATFFVVGSRLDEEGERILREIDARGHTIGIHCFDHDYGKVYASKQAFLNDFEETFTRIYEIIEKRPNVYRFPGGSTNGYASGVIWSIIQELDARGFSYYDWNVSTGDGGPNTTSAGVLEMAKSTYWQYDEPVVLMHDIKYSTVSAVPDLIRMLALDGYAFDTVDKREPVSFIE